MLISSGVLWIYDCVSLDLTFVVPWLDPSLFLEAMPCKASLQKSCTCSCLYSSAPLAFVMSRFLIPCTVFVYFPSFSLSPVLLGGFCCTLSFLLLSSSELDLYARQWNSHEHHINLQDQASVLHPPCPGPSTGRNITKSSCCLSSHVIFCMMTVWLDFALKSVILSLKRCFLFDELKWLVCAVKLGFVYFTHLHLSLFF